MFLRLSGASIMVDTGLYVGRFQPFHLGHLEAIKYILGKVDRVIIAIGSAQCSHTLENPFTAGERVAMARLALDEAGISSEKYFLIPVTDTNVHKLWVAHVVSQTPAFQVVFSNEPLTVTLFREAGFNVESIPFFSRDMYSATEIRERILRSQEWSSLVPRSVALFIKEIKGEERLRYLSGSDKIKNS
jgi:nicotinamide-nucleotide adenylyltransferase